MAYPGLMLRTGRLCLLPCCEDDLFFYETLWSDPSVCQGFGLPGPRAGLETRRFVAGAENHWQMHGFGAFSIFIRRSGSWAGFCELEVFENPPALPGLPLPAVEMAFALLPGFWGQGIASEAARAALRFGFESALAPLVFGATGAANLASQRVMRSAGLQPFEPGPFYPGRAHFWLRREHFHPGEDEYACFP